MAATGLVAAVVVLGAFDETAGGVASPTATVKKTPSTVSAASPWELRSSSPASSPAPMEAAAPPAEPPPAEVGPPEPGPVTGFVFPIAGACLTASDNQLPNAARDYRAGVHEGIDFYDGAGCAAIARGTPVLAAKAGTVIRADIEYVEMTPEERDALLARSQAQGYTDEEALDRFRGRQVWIDHGGGIVTRYAHLDGIAPGIAVGSTVAAGQEIAYVGNSGTPEGVTDPGAELHLHFEIRVDDSYLGAGLPIEQVRALLEQAFSP